MFGALLIAITLPVRAATVSSYDGALALRAPDGYNACDIPRGPGNKLAFCLRRTVAAIGPAPFVVLDAALSKIYRAGDDAESFAQRDWDRQRKELSGKGKLGELKPVVFRPDVKGFASDFFDGKSTRDTFYFALNGRVYIAICAGDSEKDCYTMLSTVVPVPRFHKPSDADAGPRFFPKVLEGAAIAVPPGWAVTHDDVDMFLIQHGDDSFQMRTNALTKTIIKAGHKTELDGVFGGLKSGCRGAIESPSPVIVAPMLIGRRGTGTFAYGTCRTEKGYVLYGMVNVVGVRSSVIAMSPEDPTSRTLAELATLTPAPTAP